MPNVHKTTKDILKITHYDNEVMNCTYLQCIYTQKSHCVLFTYTQMYSAHSPKSNQIMYSTEDTHDIYLKFQSDIDFKCLFNIPSHKNIYHIRRQAQQSTRCTNAVERMNMRLKEFFPVKLSYLWRSG